MKITPFKAFYYLAFLALSVAFVYQVCQFVGNYLEYPTYTETHLVRQYYADFPAMSLCADTGGFNQEELLVTLKIAIYLHTIKYFINISIAFQLTSIN